MRKNSQKDDGYALSSPYSLVFPEREATSKWKVIKLHVFLYISELAREQFSKSKGRLQHFLVQICLCSCLKAENKSHYFGILKRKKN